MLMPTGKRLLTFLTTAGLVMGLASCGTTANSSTSSGSTGVKYPTQPLTILVPFSSGSADDVAARQLASPLEKALGQNVIVKDVPGGQGLVALQQMLSAPANGYTVEFMTNSDLYGIAEQHSIKLAQIAPVVELLSEPSIIAVNAKSSFHTISDLVSYAKAHPGKVSIVGPGNPSQHSYEANELDRIYGITLNYVSVKGGSNAVKLVLAGQADVVATATSNVAPFVKSGNLRPLMVLTSAQSYASVPGAPTSGSSKVNLVSGPWRAIIESAKTPPAIEQKLISAIKTATQSPSWSAYVKKAHQEAHFTTGAQLGKYVQSQFKQIEAYLATVKK